MGGRSYRFEIRVDEDGNLVSSVPDLLGVHQSARSLDELGHRTRDAIDRELDPEPKPPSRGLSAWHGSSFD
jgi:predicted RNase H-like HicB family nuclease